MRWAAVPLALVAGWWCFTQDPWQVGLLFLVPAFVVLRGERPDALGISSDVDGTTWTDAGLTCADPTRVLYMGADVLFYVFVDRNVCTGVPIFP